VQRNGGKQQPVVDATYSAPSTSTAYAPHCSRPGYPSGIMEDGRLSKLLHRGWGQCSRCESLMMTGGGGALPALGCETQPSGRDNIHYVTEESIQGSTAELHLQALGGLSRSPPKSAVVITQSPSQSETLYSRYRYRYRLRLDSSAAFASSSVC